ncbi:MAG: succinate dehydrogenase cytochrome b subunit [Luteolibacter sp.]
MNALTRSLSATWSSSIGKKLVVALTGAFLVVFLAGHLAGNMLIYVGPDAFNAYAYQLHHMLNGGGVWAARLVLLGAFALHIIATISLTRQNRAARKQYEHKATIQATGSSRIMILSGLTIIAFVIYHILHFTARVANEYNNPELYTYVLDGKEVHHAWKMVIDGFSWWPATLFYLIAMTLLASHLTHGIQSIFQTLGWRSKKSAGLIDTFAKGYTAVIFLGFISIPIAIQVFGFGR